MTSALLLLPPSRRYISGLKIFSFMFFAHEKDIGLLVGVFCALFFKYHSNKLFENALAVKLDVNVHFSRHGVE